MKGDLACVIQDKLALEERLQKTNEMLKALQAVSQSIFSRSNTYEKTTKNCGAIPKSLLMSILIL